MDWKEKLSKEMQNGELTDYDGIHRFIQTEIIEKLIEEIPSGCNYCNERCIEDDIKQLRAKWLS